MDRQNDSAYYYFNKVVNSSKDSLQIAIAYNSMAVIQSDAGDYFGGQESLLTSLRFLDEKKENNQYCLVSDYNELGSISLSLKNYDAAIDYYDRSLEKAKDSSAKAITLNNKAFALQRQGEYARAARIYESILIQSKKDDRQYARVLCNLATVRWLLNSGYQAAPELLTSLDIRRKANDDWGLNSTYAHLSDYYMHTRPDSALFYSRAMYSVASKLNSPDDQLEALQKLIHLAPTGETKTYFHRYLRLRDSLETARNRAKNQFALIRYDAEKNKNDNLRLQRENAERRVELITQRAITGGAIVLFIVLTCLGIMRYLKRKEKLEWEKEEAIRKQRMQTSQRVHDIVANGLYRVMTEIEHRDKIPKEELLDKIEVLYEQSREISYEQVGDSKGAFHIKLGELITPFGKSGAKILITGNEENLWNGVDTKAKMELEAILQELMINMDKHSRARNVLIRFEQEARALLIRYSDDGVGFPANHRMGNGLTNTEIRISKIGGRISFEQNIPTGLIVRIYLPND